MALLPLDQIQKIARQRLAMHHLRQRESQPGVVPLWHKDVLPLLRIPHQAQRGFVDSTAKRKVIRAGRRGGKTVGVALLAIKAFLAGRRVLYAVPTQDQVERFWYEVKRALTPALDRKRLVKNETRHAVAVPGSETRIRAKTAFNADTLRGDFADLLILDEYQLMNEDAWAIVGAPMLLDNNGDAIFVYTPPSFRTTGLSKAHDPRHASKLYAQAQLDISGRWETFTFASHDNPHLSSSALEDIPKDMSSLAYRQEILAEDLDEVPGALWTPVLLDSCRVVHAPDIFTRIVIGIDPGHDAGIVVVGKGEDGRGYVIEDCSVSGPPELWSARAVAQYHTRQANTLVAERNHGGDMVETTIRHVDPTVTVKTVWASRGKYARAEPISVLYPQDKIRHVGVLGQLELEMCNWTPDSGQPSPNRLDALVWALTELMQTRSTITTMDLVF